MTGTKSRTALAWALMALLACLAPLAVEAKKKAGADTQKEKKEEEKWDVADPPGEWSWKTITIDTEETTWSDVDVTSRVAPCLGEAPLTSRTLLSCFQALLLGHGTFGSPQRPHAGLPALPDLVPPLCEATWPLSIAGTSLRSLLLSSFSPWLHCTILAPDEASTNHLPQLRRSATLLQ